MTEVTLANLDHLPVWTYDQVAQKLQCSKRSIYPLINSGQLKKVKVGGKSMIRRVDFYIYIESLAPKDNNVGAETAAEGRKNQWRKSSPKRKVSIGTPNSQSRAASELDVLLGFQDDLNLKSKQS